MQQLSVIEPHFFLPFRKELFNLSGNQYLLFCIIVNKTKYILANPPRLKIEDKLTNYLKLILQNKKTRVEKLPQNRSKNCRFWSTFVDFVGFVCRKCRLSTFSSVLSVLAIRSVDYRRFLSVLSVSVCFKYKRNRDKLSDKWCSGGEGG